MRTSKQLFFLILVMSVFLTIGEAYAQHPIDVQRETAAGDYMGALITYDKMPKRVSTTQSRIAAAKSAWALSLPDRALEEYDGALQQGGLSQADLARVYLGKGIIEHQEERHELAIMNADKAIKLLTAASPLRAQVQALWGESLAAMKQYAPAEDKYVLALLEADADSVPEIAFLLSSAQFELGKYEDARRNLERIPLRHDRSAEAIRLLAKIGVQNGKFDDAAMWLDKGRSQFPDAFLDSWSDYILTQGAIQKQDVELVRSLRVQAEKRYAPSDPWVALLVAAAEQYEWQVGAGK